MTNPNMGWLKLEIGPKVKCRYGDDRGSRFYGALNGLKATWRRAEYNEKIRKRINLSHFKHVTDIKIEKLCEVLLGVFDIGGYKIGFTKVFLDWYEYDSLNELMLEMHKPLD